MSKFLTFEASSEDAFDLSALRPIDASLAAQEWPLAREWAVWVQLAGQSRSQNYTACTRTVGSFGTAQEFWRLFGRVPQPSVLLRGRKFVHDEGDARVVDALMVFEKGVAPQWEDPANREGGHWLYSVAADGAPASQMDEWFNNLLLGVIGGTIDRHKLLTGIRLVDKVGRGSNKSVRVEIWHRKCEKAQKRDLETELDACMAFKLDGSQGQVPQMETRLHNR